MNILAKSFLRFSLRGIATRFVLCAVALLALPWLAQAQAAQTVVSLTFDDGIKTQNIARTSLASHGMRGTFYINSGNVGANSYYMTWADVDALAAGGNEIGGHTINHQRLTNLTTAQQQHQVCDDRTALQARGYTVTDFAYPFGAGAGNATTKSIVKNCGYTTARKVGEIRDASDCSNCPYAETIPPGDPYAVRSSPYVTGPITLAKLQGWVTQAETHGGGWVPLMFHDICDSCYDASVSQTVFNSFLDWLQARAGNGTVVKTVRDALNTTPPPPDTTPPTTTISCNGSTCPSTPMTAPVSVSLSASDGSGSGVSATRYTTNGSDPTTSSTAYTGPFSVSQTTTVKFRSWDSAGNVEQVRSQTISIATTPPVDTTPPTTTISCNGAACPTTTLNAPVSITLSASDGGGSGVSATRYTTDGTDPTTSSTAYTGAFSISSTTTIKFRSWDSAGNVEQVRSQTVNVNSSPPPGPTVTITSPNAGASVAGNVTVVVDSQGTGTGPDVDLYVDSNFNSWRSNDLNPYQIPWNATASGKGTHTLRVTVTTTLGTVVKSAPITVTVTG